MKLALFAALAIIVPGGPGATAHPKPAPAGLPNLICANETFPGRIKQTTPGTYNYRPRRCKLEAFTTPGREQSTHLSAIEWERWTGSEARGKGEIPITQENLSGGDQRVGREHVSIRLSKPRERCGRTVFSLAHVVWFYGGGINYHYRLHLVPVVGRGCR